VPFPLDDVVTDAASRKLLQGFGADSLDKRQSPDELQYSSPCGRDIATDLESNDRVKFQVSLLDLALTNMSLNPVFR